MAVGTGRARSVACHGGDFLAIAHSAFAPQRKISLSSPPVAALLGFFRRTAHGHAVTVATHCARGVRMHVC